MIVAAAAQRRRAIVAVVPSRLFLRSALAAACAVASSAAGAACASAARPSAGQAALLQTYGKALNSGDAKDTPITRVVNLLKEMGETLKKEQEEDEDLNKQLGCWCNNGKYEKNAAIEASTAKIAELTATIEGSDAKSAELANSIKELETELAADKKALAEATALRNKQLAEFQGMETDSIQALENLKAAIIVLSKHQSEDDGTNFKKTSDSWSLLETGSKKKDLPWTEAHEAAHSDRDLEEFMSRHGYDEMTPRASKSLRASGALVQEKTSDDEIVKKALKSVSAFMQAHGKASYQPSYNSQSGEIFGIMKQMEEQMKSDLSQAQSEEASSAAAFAELREAKQSEIANGEKMAETKEDELAQTDNALAEAKEDIGEEKKTLAADTEFLANMDSTCAEADKNFAERKQARLSEIQAVSETIEILQGDDARDAMSSTYNGASFLQTSSHDASRKQAAVLLRAAAKKANSPELAMLATAVELDAFTKVKKAIDDMIATLRTQQADEVKKNDWCKSSIQENEMTTAKTEDHKGDLSAKQAQLESDIKTLEEGIAAAKAGIAQNQLDLNRATEDRKAENFDFQKTIGDQAVTIEVLKKALDKLATFYDSEFLQTGVHQGKKQTPPVAQMEYKKSAGATGVMSMIEKLVEEAKQMMADSKKSEQEAQTAYETLIADTNNSVAALQKEVVTKSKNKAKATKDLIQTESDITDTMKELEGLNKENADLHAECDYVLKNFDTRQKARGEEIEALQQAKQILNGASLS